MMRKFTTAERKAEPKPATSSMVYRCPFMITLRMGWMKLSVRAETMPEKAPPMSTPMAMSITLPRRAKALNS